MLMWRKARFILMCSPGMERWLKWRDLTAHSREKGGARVRYDDVFLDVDGTLLWVDLDVEGYVEDLAPYSGNGGLSSESVAGPVWGSLRRHIEGNIGYKTEEDLEEFKRRNARMTAAEIGVEAPVEVLADVAQRRISFQPYPESEEVLGRLKEMGAKVYAVSNWDIELVKVLHDLGWGGYFDDVIASAVVGVEKPGGEIFEEALRVSKVSRERVVHVGNDPFTDIEGASRAGIDTVLVDRRGTVEALQATFVLPDLTGLPAILEG
jgi:putative hydrolase of the HAD superfamily